MRIRWFPLNSDDFSVEHTCRSNPKSSSKRWEPVMCPVRTPTVNCPFYSLVWPFSRITWFSSNAFSTMAEVSSVERTCILTPFYSIFPGPLLHCLVLFWRSHGGFWVVTGTICFYSDVWNVAETGAGFGWWVGRKLMKFIEFHQFYEKIFFSFEKFRKSEIRIRKIRRN